MTDDRQYCKSDNMRFRFFFFYFLLGKEKYVIWYIFNGFLPSYIEKTCLFIFWKKNTHLFTEILKYAKTYEIEFNVPSDSTSYETI